VLCEQAEVSYGIIVSPKEARSSLISNMRETETPPVEDEKEQLDDQVIYEKTSRGLYILLEAAGLLM
jgi:hypothetical protein